MAGEEQAGFNVVDKRRAASEPPEQAASTPETGSPTEAGTEADMPPASSHAADSPSTDTDTKTPEPEEHFPPDPAMLLSLIAMQMDARALSTALLAVFDGYAWQAMGMVANPMTGEVHKDLPTAQFAIDCIQFLLGKVESDLDEIKRREVQRRLNDLRMNYIVKLRES